MAPWPMLMTPIRPKMIARPKAARASTSVIRAVSSNDAERQVSIAAPRYALGAPDGSARSRRDRTPESSGQSGRSQRASIGSTEGRCRTSSNMSLTLGPALANLHQVGRHHHLIVEAAHRHRPLRRLVEGELLERPRAGAAVSTLPVFAIAMRAMCAALYMPTPTVFISASLPNLARKRSRNALLLGC